jgi:type II secretion system protein D
VGIFAISLPFFAMSMDSWAAAPKSSRPATGAIEPTIPVAETQKPGDVAETRQRKNVKLNYVSASWTKVLQDFAEATQTELVADRVPGRKFSRWDMKFYTRDEALTVLNQELQPLNFRLQFKGNYLVLNALQEFRHEYPTTVPGSGNPEDSDAITTAAPKSDGAAARKPVRVAVHEETRSKPVAGNKSALRSKAIRQASAQEEARSVTVPAASEPQEPIVTMVRVRERDAVTVSKVIYKAFGSEAELVDDGPRGLQGFIVRRQPAPADKKDVRGAAGGIRFAIGIDDRKGQLAIEAVPDEARAVVKLVQAVDTAGGSRRTAVRAVATKKDAAKIAAALQPELNRLSGATRRLAQQTAQQERDNDAQPAEESPRVQRRVMPQRPGLGRTDGRGAADERGPASAVPQALSRSIKGDVKVESIPDLGVLVITGNDQDVQAVMAVIQEIERLSAGTAPEVRVAFLRHVSSEALAALLTSVYERLGQVRNATVQQSQAITVFPVSRPNAILIVASKADMPAVYDLIDELDEPTDPASEFHVYRLKHAVPSQVVDKVEALYPPQQQAQGAAAAQQTAVGLVPRVKIIDDLRTNSVIVQARPRDMREVLLLIAEIDAPDSDAVNAVRLFQLKFAVADEVAQTVSQAITNVLAPSRAVTAQGQQGQPGQPGAQAQQAATGQGASELREVKSTILKYLDVEGDQVRELRSGILADIRMTADLRTNTVVVTAPEESMELVAALIRQLDHPPSAVAQIKIFKLKNSDATAMQTLLGTLFGVRTGQQGQGAQGAQQGVPGLLVEDAEDTSSMLIPLRFSVDVRTNSITAIGGAAALGVVESVLLTLDDSDIRQRTNEVYRLKNVPAATVAQAISQFLQTQRQVLTADQGILSPFEQIEREVIVVPESVSNSLLISATPRYFDDIKDVITQLDQSPKQVIISALFVEVNLDNVDEWGMEIGLQDSVLFRRSPLTSAPQFQTTTITQPNGNSVSTQTILSQSNTPGFLFNGQPLGNNTSPNINSSSIAGQIGTGFATALTNSTLGYPGLLLQAGSENLNLLLRALASRNRVDILSRPLVRTVDNQTANIQVGQYVPIVNGFTSNATTGVVSPTVQQRPIGIILNVTPRITPDGLVVMEVVARKDDLASTGIPLVSSPTGNITSPVINTKNALTTIAVPTGQTVILGGMITKNDTVTERKVPLFGDIPVLGNAFRYDFKETTRTELLIFLTPRIVHSDEEAELFKEIEMGRLNFIESEAERVHGPLHGMAPPYTGKIGPHYGFFPPTKSKSSADKDEKQPPPPPEPGLPTNDNSRPMPIPRLPDDSPSGASLMRNEDNDDEEDLDSAFIQAAYKVPQKNGEAAGRVRLGNSATAGAAGRNTKKAASKSLPKLKLKPRDDGELKARSTGADGS